MRFTRVVEAEKSEPELGLAPPFRELFSISQGKGRERSIHGESPDVGSSTRLPWASFHGDDDQDSDEEDITDLVRVVLASKRKQERVMRLLEWPSDDMPVEKQTSRFRSNTRVQTIINEAARETLEESVIRAQDAPIGRPLSPATRMRIYNETFGNPFLQDVTGCTTLSSYPDIDISDEECHNDLDASLEKIKAL